MEGIPEWKILIAADDVMEFYKNKKENFMAPFYGSLLFTTKFPEIPGTHFIDLRKMKGRVGLAATQWLESFDFSWKV